MISPHSYIAPEPYISIGYGLLLGYHIIDTQYFYNLMKFSRKSIFWSRLFCLYPKK